MAGVAVGPEEETRSKLTAVPYQRLLLSLVLGLITIGLYYPVHNHPFLNYDDRDYVYENPAVQSGLTPAGIKWAFTAYHAGNWHPLTWLSHELDWQTFGTDPAGHHDVNVLLHAIDVVLLFWVLLRTTGFVGRSFMVAALFALHPMNVESVAWVAERKNVLSTLFFLLALEAYRWYCSRPKERRYAVVAVLFALGLMAKPQIITLPFVLLLWDYWPLRRMFPEGEVLKSRRADSGSFAALFWEKVPLLGIAGVSAFITLKAQHVARNFVARPYRLGNAILSYGVYLKKAIWPTELAVLYPHPGATLNWWKVSAAGVLLAAITALVIVNRRHRYLPVGWFWFLGTLVPMIGLVQVGVQAMADRYAYLSFIGLFIMACWGTAEWAQRKQWPAMLLPGVSVVCLLLLAAVAQQQINYWESDEKLWRHTLQITTRNWVAESQLGSALALSGRVDEGMQHLQNALAMNPDDSNSHMGVAINNLNHGNYAEAVVHYQKALQDKNARPSFRLRGYIGLAKAYGAMGEAEKSQQYWQEARKLQ